MNQEKIGKNILNLRKKHNLSQSQFAKKLGVTNQAVSKWENGRGIPDIEVLTKMASEFNTTIDQIITGKKRKNQNKIYLLLTIIILILISLCTYILLNPKTNNYQISQVSSDKDNFSLKGVIVQNDSAATIYISNITCSDKLSKEKKFIAIEGLLYQDFKDDYKIISKYGDIEKNKNKDPKTLDELLNEVSFKVEDAKNTCPDINIHKYFILLNALSKEGEVLAYKIPLTFTK